MLLGNGYIGVYLPTHHRAMKNGIVYEHMLVAEQMLGRELKEEEVVHHKDCCRTNNDPENIVVFRTMADHTRFHETGKIKLMEDGTYISPESEWGKGKKYPCDYNSCPLCGKSKTKRAMMCKACRSKENYKKPEKQLLLDLLGKYNKSQIGRMFGVSSGAVNKWIKSYHKKESETS